MAAADAPSGPGVCLCVCLSVFQECCLAAVTLCATASGLGCLCLSGAVLGLYRTSISQPVVVATCLDPLSLHSMGFSQLKYQGLHRNV